MGWTIRCSSLGANCSVMVGPRMRTSPRWLTENPATDVAALARSWSWKSRPRIPMPLVRKDGSSAQHARALALQ